MPPRSPLSRLHYIRDDARLRVTIHVEQSRTSYFCVALEYEHDGSWPHIARFDSEGGDAHFDICRPDGSLHIHRGVIPAMSYDQAIRYAYRDFADRVDTYIERWKGWL